MPQPLSKVTHSGTVFIGNNTDNPSDHRPDLALLAMKVVSSWSILESFFNGIFVQMLGANPAPAAAMYSALTGSAAQNAALRALAKTALSTADAELFEAILVTLSSVAKDRNKIVHSVWGHCPSLPKAVLLCDHEPLIQLRLKLDERATRSKASPPPDIPADEIFVWTATDFVAVLKRIHRLGTIIFKFQMLLRGLHKGTERDREYNRLCNEPEIRSVLHRQRKGRKTPP